LTQATKYLEVNPRSKALARIHALSHAVFGVEPGEIGELRYQLLHGVAAAMIRARDEGAGQVAFVVHEFRSPGLSIQKLKTNASDLAAFVRRLGGDPSQLLKDGSLTGPFHAPGNERVPSGVALFIGKATRNL
jgi:hypothetical protein